MSVFPSEPPALFQTTYSQPTDFGTNISFPLEKSPPPPVPVFVATAPVSSAPLVVGSTTAVYTVQPRRIVSRHPTSVVCPHCNTEVVTQPRAEVGLITWAIAGVLILMGLVLGCCLIPFFVDECKDCYHDCPNCRRTIEVYKPM